MPTITFITGNKYKQAELTRLLPAGFSIEVLPLELDEIQSFDPEVIVSDKVHRAYEQVLKPVIVEDVSAGLDGLNGLPGPFIKYFEQRLGNNALYQIAGINKQAFVRCTMAYFDGQKLLIANGVVKGKVVRPRTMSGFGFDCVFVPNGHDKTFAEMPVGEKDFVSHRALALHQLLPLLPI